MKKSLIIVRKMPRLDFRLSFSVQNINGKIDIYTIDYLPNSGTSPQEESDLLERFLIYIQKKYSKKDVSIEYDDNLPFQGNLQPITLSLKNLGFNWITSLFIKKKKPKPYSILEYSVLDFKSFFKNILKFKSLRQRKFAQLETLALRVEGERLIPALKFMGEELKRITKIKGFYLEGKPLMFRLANPIGNNKPIYQVMLSIRNYSRKPLKDYSEWFTYEGQTAPPFEFQEPYLNFKGKNFLVNREELFDEKR